jgi:hypothetical protein
VAAAAPEVRGPYGLAGPYAGDDGSYEVRLERVPGGLRLAVWAAGSIQRSAPVLAAGDLPALVTSAAEGDALPRDEAQGMLTSLAGAGDEEGHDFGSSPGRTGELRDELRVEALDGKRVRIARWIMRPGRGWELQEAPVMLPAARFAEALASAAEHGALCR